MKYNATAILRFTSSPNSPSLIFVPPVSKQFSNRDIALILRYDEEGIIFTFCNNTRKKREKKKSYKFFACSTVFHPIGFL